MVRTHKAILSILLALILSISLLGCSQQGPVRQAEDNKPPAQSEQSNENPSDENQPNDNQPDENTPETETPSVPEEENPELSEEEQVPSEEESDTDTGEESQEDASDQKTGSTEGKSSIESLARLLPARKDYHWQYEGTAEYGHNMTLNSIQKSKDRYIYKITGEVDDMSGGESDRDFSLQITYTVEPDVIIQEKKEQVMMDSEFSRLELIRGPLTTGTAWLQKVKDKKGKVTTLRCTITGVTKDGAQKIYSVYYKDQNSNYYEKRKIKEGVGIIFFEKLYTDSEGDYTIGYTLTPSGTGYINNMQINRYLPKLNQTLRYTGYAEYGHQGILKKISAGSDDAIYEFQGTYYDGAGIPDPFTVRYYIDYVRGTVTEKVMSNERTGKREINSKLHDLVVLKLPFEKNKTWSHKVHVNQKWYTVKARILEVNKDKGTIRVQYTVEGVPGYYRNTYREERTFQVGYGMISFSNLLPGDIDISDTDAKDPDKLNEALDNHSFGYTMNK